eukprot:COSAG01_NODE_2916_length_6860_cov_159.736430_5_plen_32_part_00
MLYAGMVFEINSVDQKLGLGTRSGTLAGMVL